MIRFIIVNDTTEQMLTQRQEFILDFIRSCESCSIQELLNAIQSTVFGNIKKITLLRDINVLLQTCAIKKIGKAKATRYRAVYQNPLLRVFNVDQYFQTENRGAFRFNFDIFRNFNDIFSADEISDLKKMNEIFQKNYDRLSNSLKKKELEKITIEFSWKSSHLEGNTYTLLDTERLLREKELATGHSQFEASMIINHKTAMDFISQNHDIFQNITVMEIEEIHKMITKDLNVETGLRNVPVGIIGTDYRPLDNRYQILEALEKTCDVVNSINFPILKALILVTMISYIQPFEDGNKRTSRLMGNAALIANGHCPLSYKSVDEIEYKKAIILFYEQNSIEYFKRIFIAQAKYAWSLYSN